MNHTESLEGGFMGEMLRDAEANRFAGLADFTIDNILTGQTYYRKTGFTRTLSDLSYYLTILGSGSAGFSYHNGAPLQGEPVRSAVDRDAFDVIGEGVQDHALKVSILDAIQGESNRLRGIGPQELHTASGNYKSKANFRSNLVTEPLDTGSKVLLVGLVTEFIRDMRAKSIKVKVSDMSPELVDCEIEGIPILNRGNDETLEALAEADDAVVTGSTLSTNTVDSVLQVARENGTRLHFYLETGSNFGPQLLERGAHRVVAEKFPFYDLPGESVFEVYTR